MLMIWKLGYTLEGMHFGSDSELSAQIKTNTTREVTVTVNA